MVFPGLELRRWHYQFVRQSFDFSFDPSRITWNRADYDLMHAGIVVLLDTVHFDWFAESGRNRKAQLPRVTPGCLSIMLDARDLRFRILDCDIHTNPTITDFAYAPECWRALSTKDKRWMGLLYWLGVHADFREATELT